MRPTAFFLAVGIAISLPTIGADNDKIEPGTHTDSVRIGMILKEGDWRLNLANNCLKRLFRADGGTQTAELLQILSVTDFDLSKVTIREAKQDPGRIRFGFEFTKPDALKTVYWEADCPVNGKTRAEETLGTSASVDYTRLR